MRLKTIDRKKSVIEAADASLPSRTLDVDTSRHTHLTVGATSYRRVAAQLSNTSNVKFQSKNPLLLSWSPDELLTHRTLPRS